MSVQDITQVDVDLHCAGIEHLAAGWTEVGQPNESVDSVLDANGSFEHPGERSELALVQVQCGLVHPNVLVNDCRVVDGGQGLAHEGPLHEDPVALAGHVTSVEGRGKVSSATLAV
eukprot:2643204-Rhodomonas_salina.1